MFAIASLTRPPTRPDEDAALRVRPHQQILRRARGSRPSQWLLRVRGDAGQLTGPLHERRAQGRPHLRHHQSPDPRIRRDTQAADEVPGLVSIALF